MLERKLQMFSFCSKYDAKRAQRFWTCHIECQEFIWIPWFHSNHIGSWNLRLFIEFVMWKNDTKLGVRMFTCGEPLKRETELHRCLICHRSLIEFNKGTFYLVFCQHYKVVSIVYTIDLLTNERFVSLLQYILKLVCLMPRPTSWTVFVWIRLSTQKKAVFTTVLPPWKDFGFCITIWMKMILKLDLLGNGYRSLQQDKRRNLLQKTFWHPLKK